MVLYHRALISIEHSGVISINSPVRRQVHDASMMKLQVSKMKVIQPYHHDHIISQAPCKIKLDASTLSFACFTWLLGLS